MSKRNIGHGWSLDLPDEFHQRVDPDDQHVFWYAGRTIYAVVYKSAAAEAEAALAELARQRGLPQPTGRFDRKSPGLCGEAWLLPEQPPGNADPYWGLNSWTQSPDSLACVTFYFPSKSDTDWALSIWQTVHPSALSETAA
jgi:hypothetical protein